MSKVERLDKYIAAVVQAAPVFLDIDRTVDKSIDLIIEAGKTGAKLIAFPETWIPTYPVWIFGAAGWGDPSAHRAYARLYENSLYIGSPHLDKLCAAAREAKTFVVIGANEKLSEDPGSLYNSLFYISDEGKFLGVHRKVMPTYTERNVWDYGDGSTMPVFDGPAGRVGGLICWEHWMPMARMAMHCKNEQVHIASWPDISEAHHLASRHYAFEGKCYVICVGFYMTTDHISKNFELYDTIADMGELGGEANEIFPGGSGIIGPDGEWIVGPVSGKEEIIYGEIDLRKTVEEKLLLDVTGHYNRPDIFNLVIDDRPKPAVRWMSEGDKYRAIGPDDVSMTSKNETSD
ncbi:MAG: carbon-nitrogen hydrolase family protein [Desulfobacterales bacterium]|nr:carbon-nitrogen hydrolase family protein [Desulfobacterales bacterium]